MPAPKPLADCYEQKVDRSPGQGPHGDCWGWNGSRHTNGYGRLNRTSGIVYAHRFAYEATYGPIPPGYDVLHRCDNPPCSNPAHLFLGTQADNNADCRRKGRHRYGDRPRGERHGRAKLTAPQVLEIRHRRARGESLGKLATTFGVSKKAVLLIVQGKNWSDVLAMQYGGEGEPEV